MMQIAILVIVWRGQDYITLHDDEDLAWSALLRFVRARRDTDPAGSAEVKATCEEEIVDLFFAMAGNDYMMASADLSEIEAYFCGTAADCPHDFQLDA